MNTISIALNQNVDHNTPKHLVCYGEKCFDQFLSTVNDFLVDHRKSRIGERVFVWKNNEYVKTFKSITKANEWCLKQK